MVDLRADRRGDLAIVAAADDLPRLEDVLARHLERFGDRDELCVTWTRDNVDQTTVESETSAGRAPTGARAAAVDHAALDEVVDQRSGAGGEVL